MDKLVHLTCHCWEHSGCVWTKWVAKCLRLKSKHTTEITNNSHVSTVALATSHGPLLPLTNLRVHHLIKSMCMPNFTLYHCIKSCVHAFWFWIDPLCNLQPWGWFCSPSATSALVRLSAILMLCLWETRECLQNQPLKAKNDKETMGNLPSQGPDRLFKKSWSLPLTLYLCDTCWISSIVSEEHTFMFLLKKIW